MVRITLRRLLVTTVAQSVCFLFQLNEDGTNYLTMGTGDYCCSKRVFPLPTERRWYKLPSDGYW